EYRFVFGDSYSYTEGQLGTPEFSWSNFTDKASLSNNPILLNKTSADGPNWVEYLTGCYQGLPQHCHPKLYNLAFAGADIDPAKITKHHDFTVSFVEQVEQFVDFVNPRIKWDPKSTLGAFWIGINDVGDTVKWTNISYSDFYAGIIDTYFDKMEELYEHDLRAFMFFNIPPRDRSPGGSSTKQYAQAIDTYNSILQQHISDFASNHNDAIVITIDAFSYFNQYLDNASELGFKDISTFCPNSTAPDFNTNYEAYGYSGHPTYPVHKLLAASIEKQLAKPGC
ncbi:hypothetical protein BCR43DRAFT_430848, partial [Syncephalastrum racemosum]